MMHLMFGKLTLLDYEDCRLSQRHPAAKTFALLAEQLAGVESVTRIEVTDPPTVYAVRVDRGRREPLLVLWDHRDPFDGEDEPPVTVSWPWREPHATAVDALGNTPAVEINNGRRRLPVSLTPVFVVPSQVKPPTRPADPRSAYHRS